MGGRPGDDVVLGHPLPHPRGPPRQPLAAFSSLSAAVTAGHPCPLYVGSTWIPRHVVLAVAPTDSGVQVYNPARGTVDELLRTPSRPGELTTFGRWVKPWFVVLPRK